MYFPPLYFVFFYFLTHTKGCGLCSVPAQPNPNPNFSEVKSNYLARVVFVCAQVYSIFALRYFPNGYAFVFFVCFKILQKRCAKYNYETQRKSSALNFSILFISVEKMTFQIMWV